MKINAAAIGLVAIALLAGAACTSNKTIIVGETTTTIAGSGVAPAPTTPGTVAPVVAPTPGVTQPQPPPAPPPPTQPPPTQPPVTAPAPNGTPAPPPPPAPPKLYEEVAAPSVPAGHTAPYTVGDPLADGKYWVTYSGGETLTPTVQVRQAFFGAECQAAATAANSACEDDVFVVEEPLYEIDNMAFTPNVLLTVSDSATQKSYSITPDELRKIRASSPSAGAPQGYGFTPFAFLLTAKNNQIIKFEQIWAP